MAARDIGFVPGEGEVPDCISVVRLYLWSLTAAARHDFSG
jgi:hypothetical protein